MQNRQPNCLCNAYLDGRVIFQTKSSRQESFRSLSGHGRRMRDQGWSLDGLVVRIPGPRPEVQVLRWIRQALLLLLFLLARFCQLPPICTTYSRPSWWIARPFSCRRSRLAAHLINGLELADVKNWLIQARTWTTGLGNRLTRSPIPSCRRCGDCRVQLNRARQSRRHSGTTGTELWAPFITLNFE